MPVRDLIIIGASENGLLVRDIVARINSVERTFNLVGFLDDYPNWDFAKTYGMEILAPLSEGRQYDNCVFSMPCVAGPKTLSRKREFIKRHQIPSQRFTNIIDPSVILPESLTMGVGNVICAGVQFQSYVNLGSFIYISNSSVICSLAVIGDYSNVSNSASIMGKVLIESESYIGANSSIIGGTLIGQGSIVGMGSSVLKDVPSGEIWAGNPARRIVNG